MFLCFPAASPVKMLSCDTLSTGLEMKEKKISGAQKVCELEETAHRWVFLGNSGTGNSTEL